MTVLPDTARRAIRSPDAPASPHSRRIRTSTVSFTTMRCSSRTSSLEVQQEMRDATSSALAICWLYIDALPSTLPSRRSTSSATTVVVPMSTATPRWVPVASPGSRSIADQRRPVQPTVAVTRWSPSSRTEGSRWRRARGMSSCCRPARSRSALSRRTRSGAGSVSVAGGTRTHSSRVRASPSKSATAKSSSIFASRSTTDVEGNETTASSDATRVRQARAVRRPPGGTATRRPATRYAPPPASRRSRRRLRPRRSAC